MNPYFDIVQRLLKDGNYQRDTRDKRGYDIGWITVNNTKRYLGQDVRELPYLLSFLSNYEIESWLEIGTLDGGSLYIWKEIVKENCLFIGVDKERLKPLDFLLPAQQFEFIQGDLNTSDIKRNVSKIREKIDVVFIDDGHLKSDVERDYSLFKDFASKLIIFHDYYAHSGVKEFVDTLGEIKLIPPPDTGKVGWAVIKVA